MKTTLKSLSAIGLLAVAMGTVPVAFGDNVEMDTTGDGAFNVTPFTQFDWEAPGNAVFRNTNVISSTGDTTLADFFASDIANSTVTFDFYYQARLVAFTGAPNVQWNLLSDDGTAAGCALGAGCYEITMAMTARETATLTQTTAVDGVQELSFTGINGNFAGYIDNPSNVAGWAAPGPNATPVSPTNGAGYIDGKQFMSGTLQTVTGSFLGVGAVNPSGFNTIGTITTADASILRAVDPLGTIVGSQFRTNVSFFADPGSEELPVGGTIGMPAQYTVVAGDLVRQADANQPFTVRNVPEPATLLLLGGGLLGMAGLRRRRKG